MKRILILLALCSVPNGLARAEDAAQPSTAVANAATVYWQAFAAMPTLPLEEQQAFDLAQNKKAEPIPADVEPLIERFATALKIMHRATTAKTCDWDLNYSDGPTLLLPHLAKLRQLNFAALMRARSRFQAHDVDEALSDLLASMKMGRHAGSSRVLVSVFVGASIENAAIELLASQLPKLDKATLNRLAQELAALPATVSVADCLAEEGSNFAQYLESLSQTGDAALVGRPFVNKLINEGIISRTDDKTADQLSESLATVEKLHASLARFRSDYAEMAQIAGLKSYAARQEQAKRLEDNLAKSKANPQPVEQARVLSQWMTPAVCRVVAGEMEWSVRRALLQLAVQVQLHGPDSIKAATTLRDSLPEYKALDPGYELRYRPTPTNQWTVLVVGQPQQ